MMAGTACNSVAGLDDFTVGNSPAPECSTHAQCTAKASSAGNEVVARCVEGSCVELLSEDCKTVTGDPLEETSVLVGSLFATTGAQGATNLQREQSARLAIEEVNSKGGVPSSGSGHRKLVMLSCDAANLTRAAKHLVDDLHVPAMVGPNTSQDTINVSNEVTVPGGTVVLSPTAVASSIIDLIDDDLTWLMVPTDVQRAPLMIQQIGELESNLKAEREVSTLKLGIVYRDDALGEGTRTSLSDLSFNGQKLSAQLDRTVWIDGYQPAKPESLTIIVDKYVAAMPDIIVLAGTAEAVSAVMKPLEERWTGDTAKRPHYVVIDSTKVPDLITLATNNEDLRRRVRGTGVTTGENEGIFENFKIAYEGKYSSLPTASGTGPAYDAAYAIAFALAATGDQPISGQAIAAGLRRLGKGTTKVEVTPNNTLAAFSALQRGDEIRALGTFGPLDWDTNGAVTGGTIEMWCIGVNGTTPVYKSSGLTFSIMSKQLSGEFTPCTP